jgi:hypothetical protein
MKPLGQAAGRQRAGPSNMRSNMALSAGLADGTLYHRWVQDGILAMINPALIRNAKAHRAKNTVKNLSMRIHND